MNADRRLLQAVQQIGGAYVPMVLLLLIGKGDFQTGAWVAGSLSLLVVLVTSFRLARLTLFPGASMVPGLLTKASPACGLLVMGAGGSWVEGVAVLVTVFAVGRVAIYWRYRDTVAAVTVVLYWMAVWTFLLVFNFSNLNWHTAAVWGGGVATLAAVTFAIGRLNYGLRMACTGLLRAGPTLGVVVWGISADLGLALIIGILPSVAGAAYLTLTHNHSDEL